MKYSWHFLVPLVTAYQLTGVSADISIKLKWFCRDGKQGKTKFLLV